MEILSIDALIIETDEGAINKQEFEAWLKANSKLDWCHDTSNYRGEHDQQLGTFTLDEYYITPYVKADLAEYIHIIKSLETFNRLPDHGKHNLLNFIKQ